MQLRYADFVFDTVRANVGGFYSIIYMGSYDPILRRLRKDDVVVDGGANIGVFSILAARAVKRVYAVEPDPSNFAYLCRNIELNRATNVVPLNVALGPSNGTAFLRGDGELAHLATEGHPVVTSRLDSITNGVVTVLKLDVEGAEIMALRGQKSLDTIRLLTIEVDRPSLARANSEPVLNRGITGSFEELVIELQGRGFKIQHQNEVKSEVRRKITDRHVLTNELKTGFLGARAFFKPLLLRRKNLLRPETWSDDTHFFWMIYGFRDEG